MIILVKSDDTYQFLDLQKPENILSRRQPIVLRCFFKARRFVLGDSGPVAALFRASITHQLAERNCLSSNITESGSTSAHEMHKGS